MIKEPVLRSYRPGELCASVTDASDVGLGAVSEQHEQPVMYISRRRSKAEQGFGANSKGSPRHSLGTTSTS